MDIIKGDWSFRSVLLFNFINNGCLENAIRKKSLVSFFSV